MSTPLRFAGTKAVHTHVLLNGGVLDVTPTQVENFFNVYISDILHGERLYVAEKRLSRFKFFLDIDFYAQDDETICYEKVATELAKIIDSGECIIAVARPRHTPKGIKFGMHIIWSDLIVNLKKAQALRLKVLDEFANEDWIDGISSALRMLWSFKNEPDSTYYVPYGKVSFDGEFELFKDVQPSPAFLRMFSIQTTQTETESIPEAEKPDSNGIESYIQKYVPGQSNTRVTKMDKTKDGNSWWLATNSRYCENIKGHHRSNHVWFILNSRGHLRQKCLDDNCKTFKSREYKIPHILIPKNAVLARSTFCNVYDYFPDGWNKEKFMAT
jgi:hypothetical protein